MQALGTYVLLLALTHGSSCGRSKLYLFYDENCGSTDHHAGWILTQVEPEVHRRSNLHAATEGGCPNWANWATRAASLQGQHKWGSWDECCTTKRGQYFQVTVSIVAEDRIEIEGLCDTYGGRQVNQVYVWQGSTADGRPWYASGTELYPFEPLARTRGPACGRSKLYLFYDENCGSTDHHAGWILTQVEPEVHRRSNLHAATEGGGCPNWANWATRAASPQGQHKWGSWDQCCTTKAGQYFQVTVSSVAEDRIQIKGLCDTGGGRQVNQVYMWQGSTADGRPWYASGTELYPFERAAFVAATSGSESAEKDGGAGAIVGIIALAFSRL